RIQASAGQLDPRLHLAACNRIQTYVPDGMRPWGHTRIGLRCVEGPSPWNVFLPVTVQVFAPALVSTRALPAGAVLEQAGLERAEVDWAADPALPTTDADTLVGRQLSHPVGAGQPVRSTDIRPREWFAAGDTVSVVAKGTGFSVSSQGQALNNGIEGQSARVRLDNGRIVSGMPAADHRLDLDL
ncbi:MAG: flagellar basal body P-ring formation protein FlgA, partial [Burkholderiales bacterium]|nr:flagellar basal body P-ring formation protein FlgA [Burkholderiales bacterium]